MSYFDNFVSDDTKARSSFTPVPTGEYPLLVEKSVEGKSSAGNAMLKIQFKIEDGEYADRKLFANINLEHSNSEVVLIGEQQLQTLRLQLGLKTIKDASDLIGHSFVTTVKVNKRKDTGELVNEVVFRMKKDGGAARESASTPAMDNVNAKQAPVSSGAHGSSGVKSANLW